MKKVKVIIEAFIEVPDSQTEGETMDKIYKSGLGPEDAVKIVNVSLPGVA